MRAAVSDGQQDVADAEVHGAFLGRPAQENLGRPFRVVAHFDVGPRQTFPPPGPEAFQNGFLGRPARRKMLGGMLLSLAIAGFARREHPCQKKLAMLFDHLPDAHAFNDVATDAQNLHGRSHFFAKAGPFDDSKCPVIL